MDQIIEICGKLNWQTILAMFAIGWYFTRDIRSTLIQLENDVKQQGTRTDRLYELFLEQQKQFDQKFYDLLKEKK